MPDPITRLNAALEGRYRIESELGEGGMATVYLADDLRHERNVALKVLKPELAAVVGADRFLAEIKTTANLQHPHILPLFDSGEVDGFLFYVMPYVEGESLRDRLDREHQLPVDDAVQIAKDIAEALQAAHDQGVIHRDVKPANILLSKGRPLVSDFGIALALGAAGAGRLTETGLSLGTPHYMSPEQAAGDEDVGSRSDVYSLGCVLYEMLVGEPPYTGSTPQAILGKIIAGELASATKQRASVPANVDATLAKALEKVPADRFQSAATFGDALSGRIVIAAAPRRGAVDAVDSATPFQRFRWVIAVAVGLVAGALISRGFVGLGADAGSFATHYPIATPPGVVLPYHLQAQSLSLSRDGRRIVYAGRASGEQRLYLQDLDQPGVAAPIPGTEGGISPFFSPDGEWVGFATSRTLYKVRLSGGDPTPLADVTPLFRGGDWGADEMIYYSPSLTDGVYTVAAGGGDANRLTTPSGEFLDVGHHYPQLLPSGERIIFTSCCGDREKISVFDIASGVETPLIDNGVYARYAQSGHLLFGQGRYLMAVPFREPAEVIGEAVRVADGVVTAIENHAEFAASESGTLAFFSGTSDTDRVLVRIERDGTETTLSEPAGWHLRPSISPDHRRVALGRSDQGRLTIYSYDFERDDETQLLSDAVNEFWTVWSNSGDSIVFSSGRAGVVDLYVIDPDGSAPPRLLYSSPYAKWAHSWSPDDRLITFDEEHSETGLDAWVYSIDQDSAWAIRATPAAEGYPVFSPDMQWIAYQSAEEGQYEVYVEPFPGPGERCKVSLAGGAEPRWPEDGSEIFYREGTRAMVVDASERDFCSAQPEPLFDGIEEELWDVSSGGEFFVTVRKRDPPRLHLVQNFFAELNRLVPVN